VVAWPIETLLDRVAWLFARAPYKCRACRHRFHVVGRKLAERRPRA
jgi:hypothetical protein